MRTTNNSNRGILRIAMDEDYTHQVIFEPIDNTVWFHKVELPSLFEVTIQVINSSLDAILKSRIVDVEKTCKHDLTVSGSRVGYDVREINLEVIIAMAFRIDSRPAKTLREWVVKRCLHPGIDVLPALSDSTDFSMN